MTLLAEPHAVGKNPWSRVLLRNKRLWRNLTAVWLLGCVVILAWTYTDYGVTWDEEVHHEYGQRILRWYSSGFKDDAALHYLNLRYYGGLFDVIAELVVRLSPGRSYEMRHLVGGLCGIAGLAAVYGIGAHAGHAMAGFVAVVMLTLCPLYYGHMYNNPKDLPFAVLCTFSVLAMIGTWRHLPRVPLRVAARVGLAVGLTLGIRSGGVFLFGWLLALWGIWLVRGLSMGRLSALRAWRAALWLAGSFGLIIIVAWPVMLVAWPWAQASSVSRAWMAMNAVTQLNGEIQHLFNGRLVTTSELPWDYVIRWFAVTQPEFLGLALAMGAWAALKGARHSGWRMLRTARAAQLTWLATISLMPIVVFTIKRPYLYDGVRHLLFLLPPFVALCAVALTRAAIRIRSSVTPKLLMALVGLSAGATLVDMVAMHPYQSVYFNRLVAGGIQAAARRFEADYWGSSHKEAAEWLMRAYGATAQRRIRVASGGADFQLEYYFERDSRGRVFQVVLDPDRGGRPHLQLMVTGAKSQSLPDEAVLKRIERRGATLLAIVDVKRLRRIRDGEP